MRKSGSWSGSDWFLPALHADVHAEYKCIRRLIISSEGQPFGRSANQLMQLVHLALLGLRPCVEIKLPPSVLQDPLSHALDLPAFFSTNASRLYSGGTSRSGDRFLNIKPVDLHFANVPGGILTGPTFRDLSALMTLQILEHPTSVTAAAVEATLRKLPRPFAAIHLRTFEGSCRQDTRRVYGKMLCQTAGWATVADICSMSARYVRHYLAPTGIKHLYVAGDSLTIPQQTRQIQLLRQLGFAITLGRTNGDRVVEDVLLMTRADFFVGNPASSLSLGVARARWGMNQSWAEATTNMVLPCCAAAEWECEASRGSNSRWFGQAEERPSYAPLSWKKG